MPLPYKVEVEREKACSECDHGARYNIVGPDGNGGEIAESTAWDDEEMADMFVDAMNRAYSIGVKHAIGILEVYIPHLDAEKLIEEADAKIKL